MFSCYGKLSTEVYDLDKPVGRSFGEIEFYAERLHGVRGYILEPAVGSGRVLLPLLKLGFRVEGFDVSPEMLQSCQQRLTSEGLASHVWLGEMAKFSCERDYEAIIIPTGSFLLMDDRKESIQALRLFHKHLVPGGRLIVDVFLPSEFEMGRVTTRTWQTPDAHIITMESRLVEVDFYRQHTVTYLKYEKWQQGILKDTELQRFSLRWYGIEEFRSLLASIGFQDILVHADYDTKQPLSSGTGVFTFEATR